MKDFFRRLPLPVKLLLISLIPLAFLIYLFIQLYVEKTQKVDLLNVYLNRIHQSADMAMLIDALQEERRYSYEYALKKDLKNDMLVQRPETDSIISRLKIYKDPSLKNFTDYTFLNELKNIRSQLDQNSIPASQVMHYFTNMIFRLNTLNNVSAGSNIYLQDAYPDLVAQKLLSEMVTYLGILGANVYNVLYTRQYMVETLIGSVGVHEVYHTYEKELYTKASPKVIASYKNLINNEKLGPVINYLDTVFKNFKFDSTYNDQQWGAVYTAGIQQLRELQQQTLSGVANDTEEIFAAEQNKKDLSIILLIATLLIAIAIVTYTVIVINQMLNELRYAAQKIARGKSNFQLQNVSNDAIGSLADSIIQIDKSNKALAEIAQAIGKGNFNVTVLPRSKEDLLSLSILEMKDRLLKYTSELEEKEKQFRDLADFMPQIVWTANHEGKVDYWNNQWYEYSGRNRQEDIEEWLSILHPDDVETTIKIWDNAVQTGKDYQIEYRLKHDKTGKYKWFIGKGVASKDSQGNIVKWFGTCTEIHERKTISEKLELLVLERTEELKRSNEDLQQFAHVASHDLKEPLRKVQTFGSRLIDEYGDNLPEKGRSYLEKMLLASQRMTKMVDGILNYSTINSVNKQTELLDLNELIGGIKNDLEVVIQQRHAVIHADNLPSICGNAILMHQLFYNLINNSLKFSVPGRAPEILISHSIVTGNQIADQFSLKHSASCYHHLVIQDNGIGFNPSFSTKIFELFSRLHNKVHFEGTGLGLALCKKIVQRHHGFIHAHGVENEGAVFHIYLPCADESTLQEIERQKINVS